MRRQATHWVHNPYWCVSNQSISLITWGKLVEIWSQDPRYILMKSWLGYKSTINGYADNPCIKPITGLWLNRPIEKEIQHGFLLPSLTKFNKILKISTNRLVLILGYDVTNGCTGSFVASSHAWWQLDTRLVQGLKNWRMDPCNRPGTWVCVLLPVRVTSSWHATNTWNSNKTWCYVNHFHVFHHMGVSLNGGIPKTPQSDHF